MLTYAAGKRDPASFLAQKPTSLTQHLSRNVPLLLLIQVRMPSGKR
jgi:hypothetical protein